MRNPTPRLQYRQLTAMSDAQLQQIGADPGHRSAAEALTELAIRYPAAQQSGVLGTPLWNGNLPQIAAAPNSVPLPAVSSVPMSPGVLAAPMPAVYSADHLATIEDEHLLRIAASNGPSQAGAVQELRRRSPKTQTAAQREAVAAGLRTDVGSVKPTTAL